ncbi:MAG: HipA domain-containing protein, partial [Micrococcales bacterium]|nr:HipA domain-containing protein [Micrococcales bacterium]
GRFTATGPEDAAFTYDDQADGAPISLSMPRQGGWAKKAPYRFLDNLLPDDERTRARIAYDTDAASSGVFDLLAQIGGDVAGGLVLTATDQPPSRSIGPLLPLTDDDIAYRVVTLHTQPDRWIDSDLAAGRFSLAGAQAKFTMAAIDGRWYQPGPAVPSTHIVKPGPARFPDVEAVELATMRLARLSGIPVPETGFLRVLGQRAFIVGRFDRDTAACPVARIHGEDFAQASGMSRAAKYGMSATQAIRMLGGHDANDALGYEFVNRLAFAVATGNCDAHAKNYTVLLRPAGATFAPAYDQVATLYWPNLDTRLAMKIGGASRSPEVTPNHWAKLARTSGLDEDRVVSAARAISALAVEAAPQAASGLDPAVRDRFLSVIGDANRSMTRATPAAPARAGEASNSPKAALDNDISQQIRQARHDARLTQTDVARSAGLSRPTVARVEAGQDVSVSSIQKIAAALGLTLRVERRG